MCLRFTESTNYYPLKIEVINVFLLILLFVGVAVALLSVRLFFGKRFVKTHVDQSRAMRQRGIHCVQSQDATLRRERITRISERSNR